MRSQLARILLRTLMPLRRWAPVVTVALVGLVIGSGPSAFMHEAQLQHMKMNWDEGLYWTLSLFAVQTSPLLYPHFVYLRVLYFLAPALAASALVGAVVRLLEERGPIFLGSFRRHALIGGLGKLGATLVRHLIKHRHQVVAIERQGDVPAIEEMRAAGASLVLVGDMTTSATLRRARAQFADRLFFVSRSDVANLDAAFQVRRLFAAEGAGDGKAPLIFAHCFDSGLSDALGDRLGAHSGARIVTFNSYRFAAKALIGDLLRERLLRSLRVTAGWCMVRTEWPPPSEVQPETHGRAPTIEEDRRRLLAAFRVAPEAEAPSGERFAILGVGRFGQSVLRELLAVAPAAARFLVLDRSEAESLAALQILAPAERERCERAVGDVGHPDVVNRVAAFAPSAALICTDNDLGNLRLAVELRRHGTRAVTRMSGSDAAELSRGLDEEGITVVNVSRLFRAAIPILTQERQLHACVNLDVNRTEEVDHLFYLARANADDRRRIGRGAVSLRELAGGSAIDRAADEELALLWHREVEHVPL